MHVSARRLEKDIGHFPQSLSTFPLRWGYLPEWKAHHFSEVADQPRPGRFLALSLGIGFAGMHNHTQLFMEMLEI